MTKNNDMQVILENITDTPEVFMLADGFDDAILGYDARSERAIYSVAKCIEILMKDMSEEDAIEYFMYNTVDAYVGEHTPIWCTDRII